jgi:hypothetical protein
MANPLHRKKEELARCCYLHCHTAAAAGDADVGEGAHLLAFDQRPPFGEASVISYPASLNTK